MASCAPLPPLSQWLAKQVLAPPTDLNQVLCNFPNPTLKSPYHKSTTIPFDSTPFESVTNTVIGKKDEWQCRWETFSPLGTST